MRSSHLPAPLVLELQPSRLAGAMHLLGAVLGLTGIVAAGLPAAVALPLSLLVLCWCVVTLRAGRRAPRWLRYEDGQWWQRGTVTDRWQPRRLRRALLWPGLILLSFRDRRAGPRHCLILPDSCGGAARRCLRILLRHGPVAG